MKLDVFWECGFYSGSIWKAGFPWEISRWHHCLERNPGSQQVWGIWSAHESRNQVRKGLKGHAKGFILRTMGAVDEKRKDHVILERLLWFPPGWHNDPGLRWQCSQELVTVGMANKLTDWNLYRSGFGERLCIEGAVGESGWQFTF